MRRIDFLRGFGFVGVGSILAPKVIPATRSLTSAPVPPECILIPAETAGPFPLDLSENQTFFRQDVTEDRTGVRHDIRIKVIGLENCLPMPNVRVNIWHCDKDGNYSGYGNQTGLTYLRGYQLADANGEVNFTTIFPGWYNGRIAHIHFQVWVSSVYAAISQFTYPIAEKNAIYADNASLYTKGADPLNFNQDGIFADGYQYQLATLTPNVDTGGYDSYFEVAVQGTGITGLWNAAPETGGHFVLKQNHPNPFLGDTTVPFTLNTPSDVALEIWDLSGKKRNQLNKYGLGEGNHQFEVNLNNLGLPDANYVYQLVVTNSKGTFRQSKVMTSIT
jgi:protocatechuate 3,4-dioxygenase beta subunit